MDNTFTACLWIAYFSYAPASTAIFMTFDCKRFDGEYGRFLKADYSIDCDGDEHQSMLAFAQFLLLVYPIGIPVA